MEIKRENYRNPNRTKPQLEMFTEWHTEASRRYGRMPYQTYCRITLPAAYQRTTKKRMDILPKLPTETGTEKSTEQSTATLTDKVYQVDQDSLNTAATGISLRQKTFIGGEGSGGERSQKKRSKEKIMGEARSEPRYPPRCPQSCQPRSSLPRCLPRSQLEGHRCYVPN